ncbi:MAG: dipeptidase [Candidatus Bathyarchaeia archaeon]
MRREHRRVDRAEAERVTELHMGTLVVDAHCDTVWVKSLAEWGVKPPELQADFPKLRRGGVDVAFYAISGNFAEIGDHLVNNTAYNLWVMDRLFRAIEVSNGSVILAQNSEDILAAKAAGKTAIICSMEHTLCLQGELGILRMFHRLGLRCLQPTTHRRTWMGDGVGERTQGKLTNFGVQVVEESKRLGILIDAAHLSEACFWDLMDIAQSPVIDSHANAKAVCPHVRNLSDDQLKALADNGGVIGVTFVPEFVDEKKPTLNRLLDHVDHIVEVAGINHVGIGSDFDGGGTVLRDASEMPQITLGLAARGYSDGEIRKILGENHLRLIKHVLG